MTARPVQILPVEGLPEVTEGMDLAREIAHRATFSDADVVVVAQKVVSKAEGATVRVPSGEDTEQFRRSLARGMARRIVVDVPWVTIVETQHGLVCANAGLDASNADNRQLILLPTDPDASASRLRTSLRERTGVDVGVVITDTFGRPWRNGQTEVAIGASGIAVLRQELHDRSGRDLAVTEPAVADALAAASDLARGKRDGVPAVIIRGALVDRSEQSTAADLRRTGPTDLFARGAGQLAREWALGVGTTPYALAGQWQAERVCAAAEAAMREASPDGSTPSASAGAEEGVTVVHLDGGDAFATGMGAMAAIAAANDLGLAACLVQSNGADEARVHIGMPE